MCSRIWLTVICSLLMLGNLSCDKHERYGFVVVNLSGQDINWVHVGYKGFQTDFGGLAHRIYSSQAPMPMSMPDDVLFELTLKNGTKLSRKATLKGIVDPALDGDVYFVIQPAYSIRVDWAKTGDIQKHVKIVRGQ